MPPKRNAKKQLSDDFESLGEDSDADFVSEPEEDISSEDEKPKKKGAKAAAKKAPPKKGPVKKKAKKADSEEDSEEDDDFGSDDSEEKPKKKAAPKKSPAAKKPAAKGKKLTETTELADGFTAEPPSLLYKQFGEPVVSAKIAGFDLDGTLVVSKSEQPYMMDADDWKLYNTKVIDKLKQYHADGYKIVIFTNQGGIQSALEGSTSQKVRAKVNGFMEMAGVPALVLMATNRQDSFRKPESGMWDFMCEHLVQVQPDLASSFFVGDDLDGVDSGFAQGVGLPFRKETVEFGAPEQVVPSPATKSAPGATASGPNAELVRQFRELATFLRTQSKEKSSGFAANANIKVAKILEELTYTITEKHIKDLKNLPGVGKGSIEKIKSFLETGNITKGDGAVPDNRVAKPKDNKAMEEAAQFL